MRFVEWWQLVGGLCIHVCECARVYETQRGEYAMKTGFGV